MRAGWDIGIRLFHWLLAISVVLAWLSYRADQMAWHARIGYAAGALVMFRLYRGLRGPEAARFSSFVRGPRAVLAYVRGRGAPGATHNPVGAWNILAMLALLAVMVATGLFEADREGLDSGPLADQVPEAVGAAARLAHTWAFDALLILIAAHVLAVGVHLALGDDLLSPMITGRRAALRAEQRAP
jgi:cytochrome b